MTEFLAKFNNLEPARVRAVLAAVVALIAVLGFVAFSEQVGAVGEAVIVLVFTTLPLVQGEVTRKVVTPVFKQKEADKQADIEAEIDRLLAEAEAEDAE